MIFFPHDYPELRQQLEDHVVAISDSLDGNLIKKILCIALGGGYGRGEGGVYIDEQQHACLYNDLDYFLFCENPRDPEITTWIHQAESIWSETLGIDVEFKALKPDFLKECNHSMMAYDLVAGHHIIYGSGDFVSQYSSLLAPDSFSACEATRLLWNRGSGLFFARCQILKETDISFIHRNHQKAKLALGDAHLTLLGQYHWSATERGKRLAALNAPTVPGEVREWHAQGVEFKLNPCPCRLTFQELEIENRQLIARWAKCFLHSESTRLNLPFNSLKNYAEYPGRLDKEAPMWKLPLLAMRDYSRYRRVMHPISDYPRAGLQRVLACLNDLDRHPEALGTAERFMRNPTGSPHDLLNWESIYLAWWSQYS
jgi:hypothetical protein